MKSTNLTMSLLFTLGAATAAGCAAQVVDPVDEDPTNPDNPDDLPVPLSAEGRFAMQSEFDLATNVPGTAGTVINYFINATDDPDDPTKFIVDELIKALPAGSIKNAVQNSAPFVTGYLNDRLLQIAPNFLTTLIDVGDAFGQAARHFGTLETLDIDAAGGATKVVTGVHFEIDQVPLDFQFADYGVTEVRVEGLQVMLEQTGKLTVSEHMVAFSYGQLLKLALDKAVIPMIDPSAQNLGDILEGAVNCQAVGQYVYEAIDLGSPSTFESACNAGLAAASAALYNKLATIDGSALQLGLVGTARGIDRNRDGKMDEIQTGLWTGSLGYAGTPAPLGDAKFFGKTL